jgi:Mor family transcriptional regulator
MVTTPSKPATNDIVSDILQRCLKAAISNGGSFTDKDLPRIEREVRLDWGGDRPFIARRAGEGHSQRNSRIMRDHLAGERMALLERRYGLTRVRIWQIVKGK